MLLEEKCEELNEITDAMDQFDTQNSMIKRAMLHRATELLEDVVGANRLEEMFADALK
jgi:hypothetical protein